MHLQYYLDGGSRDGKVSQTSSKQRFASTAWPLNDLEQFEQATSERTRYELSWKPEKITFQLFLVVSSHEAGLLLNDWIVIVMAITAKRRRGLWRKRDRISSLVRDFYGCAGEVAEPIILIPCKPSQLI